jgi:5-formyltetrahydrofolate cyclo-ligase
MGLVSADVATQKAVLRAQVRARRRDRPATERQAAGIAIAKRVLELPEVVGARSIAVTIALPTEPPTEPVIDALLARGVRVLAPQARPDGVLMWTAIDGSTTWHVNNFGIQEPEGAGTHLDADVVIVPALAVSSLGHRLGQGGGYFDRTLRDVDALTVACVFDDELLDGIPVDVHDIGVMAIVTPTRTMRVAT